MAKFVATNRLDTFHHSRTLSQSMELSLSLTTLEAYCAQNDDDYDEFAQHGSDFGWASWLVLKLSSL